MTISYRKYHEIKSSFKAGVTKKRLAECHAISPHLVNKIVTSQDYAMFRGVSVATVQELKAYERRNYMRFESTKKDKWQRTWSLNG